jgi:hypothetical protein
MTGRYSEYLSDYSREFFKELIHKPGAGEYFFLHWFDCMSDYSHRLRYL